MAVSRVSGHASGPALWKNFDAAWYERRYRPLLKAAQVDSTVAALKADWQSHPQRSPNRFFDEPWYLRQNADVWRSVNESGIFESGFQHYGEVGYKNCAPHWLFSEEKYFRKNPDLSLRRLVEEGWENGYDHFLRVGDFQQRSGHPFFSPTVFLASCLKEGVALNYEQGLFAQYLALEEPQMRLARTSWYFNPRWYVSRYPEIEKQIADGRYVSPLHHYLVNETPEAFDPDPGFSESWYASHYPDVREAIAQGIFRNGYAHFLAAGVKENRQPHPDVDLAAYVAGRNVARTLAHGGLNDIFALWVQEREEETGPIAESAAHAEADSESARRLAVKRIESMLPGLMRKPLVFQKKSSRVVSAASIVVLSEGDYLSVLATLASLQGKQAAGLEIIVASRGGAQEKRLLEQATRGVRLLFSDRLDSERQLAENAVREATAEKLMFVRAGTELLPGALEAALKALAESKTGGGQILGPDLRVVEAGSALWRDGSLTPRGKESRAYAEAIASESSVDAIVHGVLFGAKERFQRAFDHFGHFGSAFEEGEGFLPLSAALRETGTPLVYVPDILAQTLETVGPASHPASQEHSTKNSRYLRKAFPALLRRQPLPPPVGGEERDAPKEPIPKEKEKALLLVCSSLPGPSEGGSARRLLGRVQALRALGWQVTVAGLAARAGSRLDLFLAYPADVTLIDGVADLEAFFTCQAAERSVVWFFGLKTFEKSAPVFRARALQTGLVLEIEGMDGQGLPAMEASLRRWVGLQNDPQRLLREGASDLRDAWLCQCLVTGDDAQARLLRDLGYGNVWVLPVSTEGKFTGDFPPFEERKGILFPLPVYQSGDAGHDAFDWFCLEVLPLLRQKFDKDIPVWFGGYRHSAVDLDVYGRFAALEGLGAPKENESLLAQCRVVVGPGRIVSAQVRELAEAAQAGLPGVVSPIVMERMKWNADKECLEGSTQDPRNFAEQLIRLYTDRSLWEKISTQARAWAATLGEPERTQVLLKKILETALGAQAPAASPVLRPRRFAPAPLHLGPAVQVAAKAQTAKKAATARDRAQAQAQDRESGLETEKEGDPVLRTRLGVALDESWSLPSGSSASIPPTPPAA